MPALAEFMAQHLPDEIRLVSEDAWCFVLPAGHAGGTTPLAGAVKALPDMHCMVLSSLMPYALLLADLQSAHPLAFWLARLLIAQSSVSLEQLQRGARKLEKHYRPGESPARLLAHCAALLAGGMDEERHESMQCGVEFMPWTDWPGCINSGAYIWLWKQNRHGRILDSRRVSLRAEWMAESQ